MASDDDPQAEVNRESRSREMPAHPPRRRDRLPHIDDTEPRVLGIPRSWYRMPQPFDLRWAPHPIRWWKWRLQVHRLGPYAPRYEATDPTKRGDAPR